MFQYSSHNYSALPVSKHIHVQDISYNITGDKGILSYIESLPDEVFYSQFSELEKRARGGLEEKSCDNVLGKNKWQMQLIERLSMEDTTTDMAKWASDYGHKFSTLFCSLNCDNPCQQAQPAAQDLLQLYRFVGSKKN